MNRVFQHGILIVCGMGLLTGCADDPYQKTKLGATLGGLVGAGTGDRQ